MKGMLLHLPQSLHNSTPYMLLTVITHTHTLTYACVKSPIVWFLCSSSVQAGECYSVYWGGAPLGSPAVLHPLPAQMPPLPVVTLGWLPTWQLQGTAGEERYDGVRCESKHFSFQLEEPHGHIFQISVLHTMQLLLHCVQDRHLLLLLSKELVLEWLTMSLILMKMWALHIQHSSNRWNHSKAAATGDGWRMLADKVSMSL